MAGRHRHDCRFSSVRMALRWVFPCPDAAVASTGVIGDTIQLTGEGTFVVKGKKGELKPKKGKRSVTGGGSFHHIDSASGDIIGAGTWTATKFISFETFGPSSVAALPSTWEAGIAVIEVELMSDVGVIKFDAVLKVGCILPGVDFPDGAGEFEGIRIDVPV